jgi:hypothetical protein
MYKISISGKAGVGKNVVSRILSDLISDKLALNGIFGDTRKIISFADPIKEIALKMFPDIPTKHLFGSSKYRSEIVQGGSKDGSQLTIRHILMDIGKQGRQYNPDLWVNRFDDRFKMAAKHGARILIVPDERFPNEHAYLKAHGFYQIRLLRDVNTGINDISETAQDIISDREFDYVLNNNHTLTDLKTEIYNNIIPKLNDY